ncbi:hypothetical protein PMI26_06172, partial [Pseudomonas sp. GM33]
MPITEKGRVAMTTKLDATAAVSNPW